MNSKNIHPSAAYSEIFKNQPQILYGTGDNLFVCHPLVS